MITLHSIACVYGIVIYFKDANEYSNGLDIFYSTVDSTSLYRAFFGLTWAMAAVDISVLLFIF